MRVFVATGGARAVRAVVFFTIAWFVWLGREMRLRFFGCPAAMHDCNWGFGWRYSLEDFWVGGRSRAVSAVSAPLAHLPNLFVREDTCAREQKNYADDAFSVLTAFDINL
jgi:hypothetical protein